MTVTIATSAADRFVCALADNLAKREGLGGVLITTAWMGPENKVEAIEFLECEWDQEWGFLGNFRREERFTWHGIITSVMAGAGEDTVRAARARCYQILAEIEAELRRDPRVPDENDVQTANRAAQLESGLVAQGVTPDGRGCVLTFAVKAAGTLPTNP